MREGAISLGQILNFLHSGSVMMPVNVTSQSDGVQVSWLFTAEQ